MKGIGKFLIFLGVSVVIILLYVFLIHTKTSKQVAELKATYRTVGDSLNTARQIANRLPETQKEYNFLKKQWTVAQGMLPTEKETENLLSIISRAATQNNVKIVSFKPSQLTTKANFQEYPLKITVLGKYHSIGRFFSDIGNLKRIIRIGDLKMVVKENEVIETVFTATGYVYSGLRDQPKGKKKGAKK
jgi:type IV pilus assembly protein PilO